MGSARRILNVVALVSLVGLGYCTYAFGTASSRVKELCVRIEPGMTLSQLEAFAQTNGLGPAPRNLPVIYLVETRTFGRWGCKVTLDAGAVRSSEYNFAD